MFLYSLEETQVLLVEDMIGCDFSFSLKICLNSTYRCSFFPGVIVRKCCLSNNSKEHLKTSQPSAKCVFNHCFLGKLLDLWEGAVIFFFLECVSFSSLLHRWHVMDNSLYYLSLSLNCTLSLFFIWIKA